MSTTGVKLEPEILERLKNLAQVKDRSVHWLMKEAITRYVANEERFEREKAEDEARYQFFLDTGSHITNEVMADWLEELDRRAEREAGQI